MKNGVIDFVAYKKKLNSAASSPEEKRVILIQTFHAFINEVLGANKTQLMMVAWALQKTGFKEQAETIYGAVEALNQVSQKVCEQLSLHLGNRGGS